MFNDVYYVFYHTAERKRDENLITWDFVTKNPIRKVINMYVLCMVLP